MAREDFASQPWLKNMAVIILMGSTLVTITGAILSIRWDVNNVARELEQHEREFKEFKDYETTRHTLIEERMRVDHDQVLIINTSLSTLLREQGEIKKLISEKGQKNVLDNDRP